MAPGEGYCQFVPLDPSVQAKGMIGENDVQAGCAVPPPLPPQDVRIREVQVHVPAADVDKIVSQVGERIVDVLRSWVSERVVFQEVAFRFDVCASLKNPQQATSERQDRVQIGKSSEFPSLGRDPVFETCK